MGSIISDVPVGSGEFSLLLVGGGRAGCTVKMRLYAFIPGRPQAPLTVTVSSSVTASP